MPVTSREMVFLMYDNENNVFTKNKKLKRKNKNKSKNNTKNNKSCLSRILSYFNKNI